MNCRVAGWGVTKYPGGTVADTPDKLNEVYLPYVDPDTCFLQILQIGRANGFEYRIDQNKQICMGQPEGGKDACQARKTPQSHSAIDLYFQGDSGGPLICNQGDSIVLHGVVSTGIGCALPNSPGIYSRITAYFDWMQSVEQVHIFNPNISS